MLVREINDIKKIYSNKVSFMHAIVLNKISRIYCSHWLFE